MIRGRGGEEITGCGWRKMLSWQRILINQPITTVITSLVRDNSSARKDVWRKKTTPRVNHLWEQYSIIVFSVLFISNFMSVWIIKRHHYHVAWQHNVMLCENDDSHMVQLVIWALFSLGLLHEVSSGPVG